MLFNSANRDDILRYYRGTYVKFPMRGDELFLIRSVDHHVIRGDHESGEEFELYYSDEKPVDVDYVIPHKSYFQYKTRACLLYRIPAKQYNRGLCSNNTVIQSLSRVGNVANHDLNFDLLKAYVAKPNFPEFNKAITSKNKMISVALSPRFAYVPEVKRIYADQTPVATVIHPDHKVVVHHKVFTPEISALAKGSIFEVVNG
jgi:hypothetical protein